ncbi:unannotated protein [freshwater metagenome]|uniref:Unannotated protein n=1 Tax=freshwater metagenome TaxID=449393 RepID=A0A6J7H5R9_9ZZZZ
MLRPAIWSLRSYWSDQNHGMAEIGLSLPQIAPATLLACSVALETHSSRTRQS